MAEHGGAPRPDVSDMYAVHGVFRDTLGAAPELVGGIEPGDTERTALIANYYENILSFLEAHHDGEEKLVFPLLRERCAGEDALIERMAEEHHEALRLLEEAKNVAGGVADGRRRHAEGGPRRPGRAPRTARRPSRRGGGGGAAPGRAEPLGRGVGCPPGHGMANFHGDKIWLILGLIRERMNDEQRAAMLEHMPPPAVEMWTGFGEQAFKDYSAVVTVEVGGR